MQLDLFNGRPVNAPIIKRRIRTVWKYDADAVCLFESCSRPPNWRGYCLAHRGQIRRGGALAPIRTRTIQDKCGYGAAHLRCTKLWGSASDSQCVECGGRAAEWAYDHTDPTELHEDTETGFGVLSYSRFPEFYAPMCKKCHKKLDVRRMHIERSKYREFIRKERV
jgi:hypothetical protein